jgi:hypothetical protein
MFVLGQREVHVAGGWRAKRLSYQPEKRHGWGELRSRSAVPSRGYIAYDEARAPILCGG